MTWCKSRFAKFVKQHRLVPGILLAGFGFTYQVLGAWILWNQDYPFWWQTEIAKQGCLPMWILFVLSLSALVSGCILLYQDSIDYRKRHPELYLEQ